MNLRPSQTYATPALAWLLILLISLLSLPGCGGCRRGATSAKAKTAEEKKKEEDALEELEKRKKKLEKPKDDFEPLAIRMLPSNDPSPSLKQPPVYVKPGHWIAVSVLAKTNNFDFPGELTTFTERAVTNEPLPIEDTTVRMTSWCPAILAKGQAKRIEGMFYVPRVEKLKQGSYSVRTELHGVRGGRTEMFNTTTSTALKDYEHLIIVLASGGATPASYTHFDKLMSVKMPDIETSSSESLRYYHVCRPFVDKSAPQPSHPLAWTTIAYVFWDDLDPAVLTDQQQQSLLDWLHWGGQLIISGPSSLDKLKGSFLADYLPGEASQISKLLQADFEELNKSFSLRRTRLPQPRADQPKPDPKEKAPPAAEEPSQNVVIFAERPMVGVDLKLDAAAQAMEGTGGLIVERRVGGGRIAVTRFPLTDVRIKQWKNFDGFFNSVLLRRPGRVFDGNQSLAASFTMEWDDPNLKSMREEPRLGSTLRYFTRDVAFEEDNWARETAPERPSLPNPGPPPFRGRPGVPSPAMPPVYGAPPITGIRPWPIYGSGEYVRPDTTRTHPAIDDWHFAGYGSRRLTGILPLPSPLNPNPPPEPPQPIGVASWNDQGAASKAAGEILTEAAGIEIPTADFVAKVLGVYLLVLVPLNWLLFWLMGKVEWAWLAAPAIALAGAGAVIRLAQLDIGFARSRTEVAVLEMQGDYERAHLTRYTALYSSLSSSYTLAFNEPTAIAAPFPTKKLDASLLSLVQETNVAFRRGSETQLTGVQVSSNSTGMVHSEQMISLGTSAKTLETLRLIGDPARGYSVRNTTDLDIRDVAVFRRVDQPKEGVVSATPKIEVAYVAKLESASTVPLRFEPLTYRSHRADKINFDEPPPVWPDQWEQASIFAVNRSEATAASEQEDLARARIRLTSLARLAADRLRLLPGDVRLVGWTDHKLTSMKIRPEAPQNRTYTLILAHLQRGKLPGVWPDRNRAEDFLDVKFIDDTLPDPDAPADGIYRDETPPKKPT